MMRCGGKQCDTCGKTQGFLLVTGEISKVLLDPTGFHALMTNSSGDTWYLNYQSHLACKALKLFGC